MPAGDIRELRVGARKVFPSLFFMFVSYFIPSLSGPNYLGFVEIGFG